MSFPSVRQFVQFVHHRNCVFVKMVFSRIENMYFTFELSLFFIVIMANLSTNIYSYLEAAN